MLLNLIMCSSAFVGVKHAVIDVFYNWQRRWLTWHQQWLEWAQMNSFTMEPSVTEQLSLATVIDPVHRLANQQIPLKRSQVDICCYVLADTSR